MASGTANSPSRVRAVTSESESSIQHKQFIELQLARTRRRVKLVDLGGVLMGLIGGILLYTLGIVLIDHWLIDLNTWQRFAALAILVLSTGYFCAKFVVPLLVRRINPTYAARAIEQSDPALKNSLINFLMFRRDTSPTSRLVYRALRQRAAQDLHTVNIDLAVDRTRLIHIGYMVVALMVVFAAYTVFSPKDVFQTVRRISIPWADIARPTRVTISDVEPGDVPVILGEQTEVSADIRGVNQDDTVTLFYSTEDKQIVNRPIPMTPPETGQLYRCMLPEDNGGIQQNLRYHIEAGDGRSAEYRLSVRYEPTIVVQKVQYDYPAYTQQKQRVVEGEGEVYAIEGTRVTIHAQANYPIKNATLEFDPDSTASKCRMQNSPASRNLASYEFRLKWDDERKSPTHASYCVSFQTEDNGDSESSVEHKISVSLDLPPDIEILTPQRREIELPVNGVQKIEIRALDPDFGLTRVVLQAVAGGKNLLDETLMTDAQGRTGQEILNYDFDPRKFDLAPGDKVTCWAIAEDNRTSPEDDAPKPNSARTDSYVINIVAADPASAGSPSEQATDAPQNNTPEKASGGAQQQPTPATPQPPNNQPPNNQPPNEDKGADSQPSDPPEKNNEKDNQDDASQQTQQQQQSGSQSDPANPQQSSSSDQGSEGESGAQPAGQTQAAQQGQETQGSQSGSDGQQQESGQAGDSAGQMQSGSQNSGSGSSPQGSSQPSGAGGSETGSRAGQQSQSSQDSPGGSGGSEGSDPSTDGGSAQNQTADGQQGGRDLHDGEAFDRMMKQFASEEGSPAQGQTSQQSPADPNGNRPDQETAAEQNSAGATGDQSQQDGAAGQESPSQQPAAGSPSEMIDAATPSNTQPDAASGSEAAAEDSSDHPGKPAKNDAGQGENGNPQQGPGEEQSGKKQPKSVEGSEKTTNPDSGPTAKQSGQGDEGEAGSGEPTDDPSGSPSAQKANRDRDKTNKDAARESTDRDSAQGTSKSEHQSSSQGDDEGSQSGGGQHGGGQPANQPGRDSPGSNMSSDQGNTGSPESGQGETADRGGDKQQAPHATGESGEKPGPGSQSAAAPNGQQQAPEGASPTSPHSPAETNNKQQQPSPDRQSPDQNATSGGGSGPPQGGGLPGDSTSTASRQPKEIPDGDEANLEYARKATDLVLQRLRDQQDKPDPKLLKSLGWTKEELQQFIARWEALKQAAREERGESRAELDDALRSLGLRPTAPVRQQSQGANDQVRGMHDSGDRSRPPAEFLEQYNAYKKGAARGPSNGGH